MAPSLTANIIIVSIVFSVIAIVAVILRLYCRRLKRVRLGPDDFCILPALAFAVAMGITNIISALKANLGGHVQLGPNGPIYGPSIQVLLQCEWAIQMLSIGALTFTKTSILLFYRRIFRGPLFDYLVLTLGIFTAAWGVSFFFATLFECMPISQVWTTFYGQPRKCYKYLPMFYGTAISNMLIDFMIILLPWPMIWRLQMPTRQKFAIGGIFTLGALVCGISITRLVFFVRSGKPYANAYDVTYIFAPTLYWTQLEGALAVVSACLPTMRPLFHGFSLESMIGSFRAKIPTYRQLHKGSHNQSSTFVRPSEEDESPLNRITKTNHAGSLETYVESVGMDDLEVDGVARPAGITIRRDLSSHSETM